MKMIRRRFLGVTAGALVGSFVGIPGGRYLGGLAGEIDRPVRPPGGREDHRLSTCTLCPGGCGVRVRCIGGRPVKVKGNPLHPISGGRLCPKGEASLQALLHPDRLQQPLRRAGPRGDLGSFEAVTWGEALEEIAVRLALLRRQGRPEALCLLRGPSRGLGARLAGRFLEAFGSPNDVRVLRGDQGTSQALQLTQGLSHVPVYDVQRAEYVLSLGSALLEASSSPVYSMRAFGEFRQGPTGRHHRMVHAGPRMSLTAAQADDWVRIRPGTEGVLALGVAAVLVAEGLYDHEFVELRCHQFEDYEDEEGNRRPGLRTLLAHEFPLERVARETGISVNRILQVSREFSAARPGLAIGPRGGPLVPGQLFDHLAVHVLNALAGNIDAPGGILVPEEIPLAPWPDLAADEVAEAGRGRSRLDGAGVNDDGVFVDSDPERLAEAILARSPYQADACILLDTDPAFASLAPDEFAAALEQVPLVVSMSSLPTDSGLLADWILPTTHAFESWELDLTPPGVPFPLATLSKPVTRAAADARSAASVFLELARRLGGPLHAALPWSDERAVARAAVKGLFSAQRGAVLGTEFDEAWVRLMERAGWWAPGYRSEDELWERAQETGGWWDPFYDHRYWKRVLRTASGRFEFRPRELMTLSAHRRGRAPVQYVGERTPGRGHDERALALHLFEPLPVSGGVGAELPFLQEILDPGHEAGWETWVELHPETAEELSLRDRSTVRVTSARGSVRACVLCTDRVLPGVAAMPVGLGKRAGGRWAAGRGVNPLRLASPARERLSGLPDPGATLVRIVADEGARGADDRGRRA